MLREKKRKEEKEEAEKKQAEEQHEEVLEQKPKGAVFKYESYSIVVP